MEKLLYQIKSLGIFKILLYMLLYPLRYIRSYFDWAHKIRSEKRSHMTIYNYAPDSLITSKPLSSQRKKAIEDYYKTFGLSINTRWHETFSAITGIDSNQYISEYHFYQFIEPHFNDKSMVRAFADKNMYSRHFPDVTQPGTILRSIGGNLYDDSYQKMEWESAVDLLQNLQEPVIIKPSIQSGKGRNVNLLKVEDDELFLNDRPITLGQIQDFYDSGFIIQEFVKQHKNLNALYPHSVNTIKVISFRYRDEIRILSSFFRAGNDGHHIDSVGQGGFLCGIKPDGSLSEIAYDKNFKEHQKHPSTNTVFGEVQIPNFEELKETVKTLHADNFYCDIASWDLSVNEDGETVLIETNISSQGIFYHQVLNGPLFGELTDTVLSDVFK